MEDLLKTRDQELKVNPNKSEDKNLTFDTLDQLEIAKALLLRKEILKKYYFDSSSDTEDDK